MQKIENYISRFPGKTFAALLFLAIPPFFINLGLLPLFADEPTRANVALEMILSGNYSVPTIGGEYYYNKPPVYNYAKFNHDQINLPNTITRKVNIHNLPTPPPAFNI